MKEDFSNLVDLISEAYPNVLKAEKGNKSAAARLRKQMREARELAKLVITKSKQNEQ